MVLAVGVVSLALCMLSTLASSFGLAVIHGLFGVAGIMVARMFKGARTYLVGAMVAGVTSSLWGFATAPLGGPRPVTANGLLAWLELTLAVAIASVAIVSTVHRAASHVLGHRGFRSTDVPPEVTCPSPQRGHDRQCEE
jgi:hypothetical protein